MKRRIIFHLPFEADPNRASGSQIRPIKMLTAFQDIGYEVDVVMGNSKDRKRQIEEIERKIKQGVEYSFLYSESSTMPTLLTDKHHLPLNPFLDFGFFKRCKKNGIPIGLFYRDIYWMYEEYKKDIGKIKSVYSIGFYKWDLLFYKKYLDVLFLPSLQMAKKIPSLYTLKKYALPSGCDSFEFVEESQSVSKETNVSQLDRMNILYVGGLGDFYDLSLFCDIVSGYDDKFMFTICCRKEEWNAVKSRYEEYLTKGNIFIVHEKGKGLDSLYEKADLACLFVEGNEYRNFAMPFKLFEYLGRKKPIIASSGTAVGEFVEKNGIGWVADYNANNLSAVLNEIINKPESIEGIKSKIDKALNANTWIYRAKEVRDLLAKEK